MADVTLILRLLGLSEVQRGLASVSSAGNRLASSLTTGLASALGITLSVGGVIAFTKALVNQSEELLRLSKTTGMTVEMLSKLQFASKIVNVDFGTMTASTRFLSKALLEAQDPGSKMGELFTSLGVDARKFADDTEGAFIAVGEAIGKLPTHMERVNAARQVFGRAGAQLLPAFVQGELRDAIKLAEQLGLVISTETAIAADQLNKSITTLTSGMRAWIVRAVEPLIPLLAGLAQEITATSNNAQAMAEVGKTVVNTFQNIIVWVDRAQLLFRIFGINLGAQTARLVEFARIWYDIATDPKKMWEQLKKGLDAIPDIWRRASKPMLDAQDELDELFKQLENSGERWSSKFKKYQEENAKAAGAYRKMAYSRGAGPGLGKDTEEAIKANEKLVESLKDMRNNLREQYETFGLAEASIVKYKLAYGELSKAQGKAAKEYREEIEILAEMLDKRKEAAEQAEEDKRKQEEQLRDQERAREEYVKGLQDEVVAWRDLLDPMREVEREHDRMVQAMREGMITAEQAAQIMSEKYAGSYKDMLDPMREVEREQERLTQLMRFTDLSATQASQIMSMTYVKQARERIDSIKEELSMRERMIDVERQTGATSEFESMLQLQRARTEAVGQYREELAKLDKQIASGEATAQTIQDIRALQVAMKELEASADVLGTKMRSVWQQSFSDEMLKVIHGTESVGEAFKNMARRIIDTLLDMALQVTANQIWQMVFGGLVSGAGAGGGGWLAAAFGAGGGGAAAVALQHGGSFVIPGTGAPDSRLVSFMATPGERVTVDTPAQALQRDYGSDSLRIIMHQTVNVGNGVDIAQLRVAMASAKEQTKAEIIQSMRRRGAFYRA